MARTKREQELIARFLESYNEDRDSNYKIARWPDEEDSTAPAVDVVANDAKSGVLAIEHTILQPFVGEKNDSAILLKGIANLEKQPHLIQPGFDITLTISVGAIPKGTDWKSATATVERWYMSSVAALPIGRSKHRIPGLNFDLDVDIDKERAAAEPHFFISR